MSVNLTHGEFTKEDLIDLPHVNWGDPEEWWDALLIVPTPYEHDSGWSHIAIIGVRRVDGDDMAVKVLATPDDIHWPARSAIGAMDYGALNMDSYHPQGVLRLWSRYYDFSASGPVSSVDILLKERKGKE